MNMQVIARPDGAPLWFSRPLPGRTHDLTAARIHGTLDACLTREILILADRAYQDASAIVRTPYYHHRDQHLRISGSTASMPACELPANTPSPA
ncbi:hypothetical protein GO001_12860 [Streptomyces sp. NRRL B-1677]|nr:hypothetical protein [Streptomyces sp. NRRL B-1677]